MTQQTRRHEHKSNGAVKMFTVSLLISALAESIYATVSNRWNEYAIILLIGILFSLILVPSHYLYEQITRNNEE